MILKFVISVVAHFDRIVVIVLVRKRGVERRMRDDAVDRMLVEELCVEEPGWVDYDDDVTTRKLQLSNWLQEALLADTVYAVDNALCRRQEALLDSLVWRHALTRCPVTWHDSIAHDIFNLNHEYASLTDRVVYPLIWALAGKFPISLSPSIFFFPLYLSVPCSSPILFPFYARKQLLLSARLSHCNSVCLSVCHTGGSVKNGASYDH